MSSDLNQPATHLKSYAGDRDRDHDHNYLSFSVAATAAVPASHRHRDGDSRPAVTAENPIIGPEPHSKDYNTGYSHHLVDVFNATSTDAFSLNHRDWEPRPGDSLGGYYYYYGNHGHGAGPSTATAVPDAISGWDWHPQQAGSLSDDEPLQPVQVSTGTAQAQGQTEEDFPEPLHFSVATLFMAALLNVKAYHWINILKEASDILCILLQEDPGASFSMTMPTALVEGTLAKAIFNYSMMVNSYGLEWMPEEVGITLPNGKPAVTQLSNAVFKNFFILELKSMSHRFSKHIWLQAIHLIKTPSPTHLNSLSLIPLDSPINISQLEWWVRYNDGYGYGIFHGRTWNQATQSYTLEPFGNTIFQQAFWRAVYGQDQPGYFHFVNRSSLSAFGIPLHTAAITCGWLISAASYYQRHNTHLVAWCSIQQRHETERIVKMIYDFFVQTLLGLPGMPPAQQRVWAQKLVQFLGHY